MLQNHRKRYTELEKQQLASFAKGCKDKEDMYERIKEQDVAKKFSRTEAAICKQIEKIHGWHWAAKK